VLLAVISSLVAIISPFWGLIFWTVNICDLLRKKAKDVNIGFAIFGGVVIISSLSMGLDSLRIADVLIGIGVISYLFTYFYIKKGFRISFSAFALFQCCYGLLRKVIFADNLQQSKDLILSQLEASKELLQSYQNVESQYLKMIEFYFQYSELFWIVPMIFALVIGMILTRKNVLMKFHTIAFKLPDNLVYVMILGMVLAIFEQTRFIGLPITITFVTLLAIQGFPIVWLWLLGSTFNNTLLRILTYIIILINFHIFIIISCVVGLIDIWFNLKNGVQK
jgi:hypothetical protein